MANLLAFLSQITSFDLETIDFERIDSDPVVEMAEWIRVAQLLTEPRFMRLQRVHLALKCSNTAYHLVCPCTDWEHHIRQQISVWGNILHVSVDHLIYKWWEDE